MQSLWRYLARGTGGCSGYDRKPCFWLLAFGFWARRFKTRLLLTAHQSHPSHHLRLHHTNRKNKRHTPFFRPVNTTTTTPHFLVLLVRQTNDHGQPSNRFLPPFILRSNFSKSAKHSLHSLTRSIFSFCCQLCSFCRCSLNFLFSR